MSGKPGDYISKRPQTAEGQPKGTATATTIQSAWRGSEGRKVAKEEEVRRTHHGQSYEVPKYLGGRKSRRGGRKSRRGGRKSRRGGRKSRKGGRKSCKGGRMRTRASLKRAQKSYRRRRKASQCRGKGPAVCRSRPGCKYASGKKRSFCRNKKSTRRARR